MSITGARDKRKFLSTSRRQVLISRSQSPSVEDSLRSHGEEQVGFRVVALGLDTRKIADRFPDIDQGALEGKIALLGQLQSLLGLARLLVEEFELHARRLDHIIVRSVVFVEI